MYGTISTRVLLLGRKTVQSPLLKQPAIASITYGYKKISTTMNPRTDKQAPLPFHSVPGPTALENLTEIYRKGIGQYHHITENYFERYGPIYKVPIPGTTPYLYISLPDDVEKVFSADGYPPVRPKGLELMQMYYMKKRLSKSLLSNDENWHRHRQSIAPYLLRPFEIQHLVPLVCDTSDFLISSFHRGRNEDVAQRFQNWSTQNIASAMFGFNIGLNLNCSNEKARNFINATLDLVDAEGKATQSLPFHRWFLTPTLKRAYRALDTITDITSCYMEEASKVKVLSQSQKPLIQKILETNPHNLTKEEIIQLTSLVFTGGVDSTALTAIGLFHNLSKFPRVQKKLHEEIRRVLPNDDKPTHKKLAKMPYLRATIKESLRVYPAVLGNIRQTARTHVLSGYEIPAGTVVLMSNFCSKVALTSMFADFADFRPERWLRGSKIKNPDPFAFLPFGKGVRMCVGMRLAQMEISTLVVRMLQKYEIEKSYLAEDQIEWKFSLVMDLVRPFNLKLKEKN